MHGVQVLKVREKQQKSVVLRQKVPLPENTGHSPVHVLTTALRPSDTVYRRVCPKTYVIQESKVYLLLKPQQNSRKVYKLCYEFGHNQQIVNLVEVAALKLICIYICTTETDGEKTYSLQEFSYESETLSHIKNYPEPQEIFTYPTLICMQFENTFYIYLFSAFYESIQRIKISKTEKTQW